MRIGLKIGLAGCAALVLGGVFAGGSHAALLVDDGLNYADGNLVGRDAPVGGVWAAHSGAGSFPVQVSSGKIVLAHGGSSREDVNIPFQGGFVAGAGTKLYAAFDLTVPDPGVALAEDVYFAHFLHGTSNFTSRVWITDPIASGYRLALSNDNSMTDGDGEVFTGDLAFGQTYRIVSSYDYDTGTGSLWINPTSEASPSISATDPGFSNAVFAYAFRQAISNSVQQIDNLQVGTTFADVLIPEPSMLAFGALAAGALIARRRRVVGN